MKLNVGAAQSRAGMEEAVREKINNAFLPISNADRDALAEGRLGNGLVAAAIQFALWYRALPGLL